MIISKTYTHYNGFPPFFDFLINEYAEKNGYNQVARTSTVGDSNNPSREIVFFETFNKPEIFNNNMFDSFTCTNTFDLVYDSVTGKVTRKIKP